MSKPILYLDMDGVLVDFPETTDEIPVEWCQNCINWCLETGKHHSDFPGIFGLFKPLRNAIQSVKTLTTEFEVYILSSPPWNNPTAWVDKRNWVEEYLPLLGSKRLILRSISRIKAISIQAYAPFA